MSTLLIVESGTKAKKISKWFPDMTVMATVGHIRELPVKSMGVKAPDFKPDYDIIAKKSSVVGRLRSAANAASKIYIATDLDREGEAIGWHVLQVVGKANARKAERIKFNIVSKTAVENAIAAATVIDINLVRAQEVRRVLDRLVGYGVSPILQQLLNQRGLSAGRVQSVALMLICTRESDIASFDPITHFGLKITLSNGAHKIVADWDFSRHLQDGEKLLKDKTLAQTVQRRTHSVIALDPIVETKLVPPPSPLITADLLENAATIFGWTAKEIMAAAQALFEEGLITYHRTDAAVIDPAFVDIIRRYAFSQGLPLPEMAPNYAAEKNAQEAHEGIRVSDIELRSPNNIASSSHEAKLYQYIWFRTLASQLSPAHMELVIQPFENNGASSDETFTDRFLAKSTRLSSAGWREAASGVKLSKLLPELKDGQPIAFVVPGKNYVVSGSDVERKKTKPPLRYSEAGLIKKMKSVDIGRPSTYASIIETLLYRKYIERTRGYFVPLGLGTLVFKCLNNQFQFMAVEYTANIESEIDQVAQGAVTYFDLITKVFTNLQEEQTKFSQTDISHLAVELGQRPGATKKNPSTPDCANSLSTDKSCTDCEKGHRVLRNITQGKNKGKQFFGCSNFPTCRYFLWKN